MTAFFRGSIRFHSPLVRPAAALCRSDVDRISAAGTPPAVFGGCDIVLFRSCLYLRSADRAEIICGGNLTASEHAILLIRILPERSLGESPAVRTELGFTIDPFPTVLTLYLIIIHTHLLLSPRCPVVGTCSLCCRSLHRTPFWQYPP